jgi:hypothetical protein
MIKKLMHYIKYWVIHIIKSWNQQMMLKLGISICFLFLLTCIYFGPVSVFYTDSFKDVQQYQTDPTKHVLKVKELGNGREKIYQIEYYKKK